MIANFPPYAYVPGKFPHPHSDPRGHRFGSDVEPPEAPLAPDWPRSLHYRLAVDLFNHGYYWEAHEFWEALWHAAGRTGIEATFFKALIQLAVVGVKIREGRPDGAIAHAQRAVELLTRVRDEFGAETLAGVSLRDLGANAESLCGAIPAIESNDQTVQIVFSFRLT
ncbi:MAG: DUF309 domain-containing protein [Gemmataceae bacterium]|nr:DUF309 domain-containing protein [Gemmataceae bacterium]